MRLDQFDKLEQNIRDTVDYIYTLKVENRQLKKEIENLRSKLSDISEKGINSLEIKKEINKAGESLKEENKELAISQLDNVLERLKNLSEGVEFK